jgi:cell shape-determining protein MreC
MIMTHKWASLSKGMLFGWGILFGLIFLFLVPRDAAGRLQLVYAQVFRWPLSVGTGVVRISQTTPLVQNVSPKQYEDLLKASQQLRNSSANLQAQLQEAQSQIERLTRLRAKPGLEHMQPIPAKVITHVQNELTISQGQESGVAVGQCVLSFTDARLNDQCVVGTVASVSSGGAKVKLITHSSSKLPAGIDKLTGEKFILEGRGNGLARIPLVPTSHALHPGDAIYAQKRPGFLDVPVIMAEIAEFRRDPDNPTLWDITVQPVCDLAALDEVVVMKPVSVP